MREQVSERLELTPDTTSWSFKRTDGYAGGFQFTPGQFLSIKFDQQRLGSATPVAPRHYTITSAPGDDHLQARPRPRLAVHRSRPPSERPPPCDQATHVNHARP